MTIPPTSSARPRRDTPWILAGILLVATAALVLVLRTRATRLAPIDLGPRHVFSERAVTVPPVPPAQEPPRQPSAAPTPATPDEAAELATAPEPTAEAPPLTVRGVVRETGSGLPLPGLEVGLSAAETGGGRPPTASAVTDAGGEFTIELAGPAWNRRELCTLRVLDPRLPDPNARPLFRGLVAPIESVDVDVTPAMSLRGRVVCDLPPDATGLGVQLYVPPGSIVQSPLFLAHSRLDGELRFHVLAHVPADVPTLVLQLASGTSVIALRAVDRSALATSEGAEVFVDLRATALSVVDRYGTPIAGAEVRACGLSLLDPPQPFVDETDEDGRVTLVLERGPVELCVAREGWAPVVSHFRNDAGLARTIQLRPLEERDLVEGRVLAADGAPVADAFVSAAPSAANPEVAVAGLAGCRSDADGRFRMHVNTDAAIDIGAFHRRLGSTPRVPVLPDGRALLLRYELTGELVVRLTGAELGVAALGGPVEYLLVDQRRERTFPGHRWSAPITIGNVPAADYNLLVRTAGGQAYGETSVRVPGAASRTVEVDLAVPSWFAGRVVNAAGSPVPDAAVRLEHPEWPAEVEDAWGGARTDADGRFRVFGGALSTAEVRVTLRGRDRGAFAVRFDRFAECALGAEGTPEH